jgi:hypothetical protein
MARPKKNASVSMMIDYANDQLKRTDEFATKEFKEGVCVMIQQMMHRTNTYSGFMFNNNDDSETGTLGYYSRRYFKSSNL